MEVRNLSRSDLVIAKLYKFRSFAIWIYIFKLISNASFTAFVS